MSDDVERRLTVQLRERVPEPPKISTAQDVWDRGPTSRGRRVPVTRAVAVLGIAAVVLAVALTSSLWRRTPSTKISAPKNTQTSEHPPFPAPVITDPRALVGPTWVLRTYQLGNGSQSQLPQSNAPTITIYLHGEVIEHDCSSATSKLGNGRIVFRQPFARGFVPSTCEYRTSVDDVVEKILSGTVTWSITAGTLTVRHSGIGQLVFDAVGADATITGEVFVVGGPKPVKPRRPKPVVGANIVLDEAAGSYPVRARTGANGLFTASVTPGTWKVTATVRNLHGVECSAGAPVDATAHRTAHVRVYCSIR